MKNLILAVVVVLVTLPAFAQTPKDNRSKPPGGDMPPTTPSEAVKLDTPNLTLSEQEKAFLKLLSQKLQPVQQGLQDAWQGLLATEDEKEALNLWLKARLLNIKATDIQKEFIGWFDKIKILHHCPTCVLEGDKLVAPKPAPAAPTPKP